MKNIKKILYLFIFSAFFIILPVNAQEAVDAGFDQYGYNYQARVFNGIADGIDRSFDGCIKTDRGLDCNRPDINDRWLFKWSQDWDRGIAENWSNGPYEDAWQKREINGVVSGGSQTTEHTKIIWVGVAGMDSPYWQEGGVLWKDQFEIIFLQGKDDSGIHFWEIQPVNKN